MTSYMNNQARRETAGLFSFFRKNIILHIINKKEITRRHKNYDDATERNITQCRRRKHS